MNESSGLGIKINNSTGENKEAIMVATERALFKVLNSTHARNLIGHANCHSP